MDVDLFCDIILPCQSTASVDRPRCQQQRKSAVDGNGTVTIIRTGLGVSRGNRDEQEDNRDQHAFHLLMMIQ